MTRKLAIIILGTSVLLLGVGCGNKKQETTKPETSQPVTSTANNNAQQTELTKGSVEVRDPNGEWRTFLPPGVLIDPHGKPRQTYSWINDKKTEVVPFYILPYQDYQGPIFFSVLIFHAPTGTPKNWYATTLERIHEQGEQPGELGITLKSPQHEYLYWIDPEGNEPTVHMVTVLNGFGFDFQTLSPYPDRPSLYLPDYLLDHFVLLKE